MTSRVEHLSESVTLYLGDCREILPVLPQKVDAVITDPPYGETSLGWDARVPGWPALVRPLLAPITFGSMWVFGSMRMFLETAAEFGDWKLSHDLVWEKHNGTGLFNDRFRRVHEHALHWYPAYAQWDDIYKCPQFTYDARVRVVRKKGRPAQWIGATGETTYVSEDGGPRLQRSVIYARSEHGRAEHPTQKPLDIIKPLLLYACPPDGTVLDLFMGSGSIGVVARQQGRKFIGIEADEEYFDIACRRIDDATRQTEMFIERPKPAVQEVMVL